MLCSLVLDLSFDVHKDQVLDGFGVEQPTCDIIFNEYVWESKSKQEFSMKDDLLPPAPLLHYPDIFHNSTIPFESCEKSVYVDVTTFNHSQNKWNANFSFERREDKSFLSNPPNLSSYLSKNLEGEIYHFSSSPLYDSSDHGDASIYDIELSDHGFRDLFIDSFGHDSHFSLANISQPLICDYLPSDGLGLP